MSSNTPKKLVTGGSDIESHIRQMQTAEQQQQANLALHLRTASPIFTELIVQELKSPACAERGGSIPLETGRRLAAQAATGAAFLLEQFGLVTLKATNDE